MNSDGAGALGHGDQTGLFAATQWSVVSQAKDNSELALETLFRQYREPLLVWLRAQGYPHADAEDTVQAFMQGLLRRNVLKSVAPEKGKFRTFLLKCLKNHLRDEHARKMAAKRGGGQTVESLNLTDQDGHVLVDTSSRGRAPDLEFDHAWAQSVLTISIEKLQKECASRGHADLWIALEPVLFFDETALPYRDIGIKLGMTEAAVKMAVSRIRARLKALVREQIIQTVANEQDLEEEVQYLIQLFAPPA